MTETLSPVGEDIPTDIDDFEGDAVTVRDLNRTISTIVENSSILSFDYVVGDVTNVSVSNGNTYFTLVHAEHRLQCLVFKNKKRGLPEFTDEDRVAVKGELNYYKRGECTLLVDGLVLFGESERQRRISEIRSKLSKEGIFSKENKQELPFYPRTIGIVTSAESDGEEDAITSIRERAPAVDIHLYNANVQGDNAVEDICEGVMYFDQRDQIDLIVITRGGGASEDLHAFNTEACVRTTSQADTPIVTAIGHESDTPLVDLAADKRAMTPTEIGTTIVPDIQELMAEVEQAEQRLTERYNEYTDDYIQQKRRKLDPAYEDYIGDEITTRETWLKAAYEKKITATIKDKRTALDHALNQYHQQREHEQVQEELRTEKQKLQYILAAVVSVFILFLILIFLFLI